MASETEKPDQLEESAAEVVSDADLCPEMSDPRSPQILQYALEGRTWDEIAGLLKIDVRTLLRIRRREGLDDVIDQITQDSAKAALREYMRMRQKGFTTVSKLMDSPDREMQLRAAKVALGFVSAKENAETAGLPIVVNAPQAPTKLGGAQLAELQAKAEAARRKLGSGGSQTGGSRR